MLVANMNTITRTMMIMMDGASMMHEANSACRTKRSQFIIHYALCQYLMLTIVNLLIRCLIRNVYGPLGSTRKGAFEAGKRDPWDAQSCRRSLIDSNCTMVTRVGTCVNRNVKQYFVLAS